MHSKAIGSSVAGIWFVAEFGFHLADYERIRDTGWMVTVYIVIFVYFAIQHLPVAAVSFLFFHIASRVEVNDTFFDRLNVSVAAFLFKRFRRIVIVIIVLNRL